MFSEVVHSKDSAIGQYYQQVGMEDEDLLYYSRQEKEGSNPQPDSTQSPVPKSPQWLQSLLQLFHGRRLLQDKVLKVSEGSQQNYNKQKLWILLGLVGAVLAGAFGIYFGGVGTLLTLVLLGICVCMYFLEMGESKLQDVLANCGSTSSCWQSAYRRLYKYIKQVELVYAQINLKDDADFTTLLKARDEPIEKCFTRPRVACLQVRILIIQEIRNLQRNLLNFMVTTCEIIPSLKPKLDIEEILSFQLKDNSFYTLSEIKNLYSTLSLIRYEVKQIMTFLILNPSVTSMFVYEAVQTLKQIRGRERDSAITLLSMLESYQQNVEQQGQKIQEEKMKEQMPRVEIVKYCKERTHLLNIYYSEYISTQDAKCVELAMNELKGISLCLSSLSEHRKSKQQTAQQDTVVYTDTLQPEENTVIKKQQEKGFYIDQDGETQFPQLLHSQIAKSLEHLLENKTARKREEKVSVPDQRVRLNFLSELQQTISLNQVAHLE